MSQEDQEKIDLTDIVCDFCKTAENDEMHLGKKYVYRKIKVHYFCLLLSSEAYQTGQEHQGILGFMPTVIAKVRRKSAAKVCCYCKKRGASLVCCQKTCKNVFHLPCGIREKCITHYFDQFETFCDKHSPTQIYSEEDRLYSLTNSRYENACGICYENLLFEISYHSLWAPCCRNGWFHRDCVLKLAHSAGHAHFKCPLCNNKDVFVNEMQRMGIYIPYKDASWELEPDAYHDLYLRYNQCDADPCLCPFDRTYNGQYETDWMLMLCQLCGSSGMHKACLQNQNLSIKDEKYCCNFCLSANNHLGELSLGSGNSSSLNQTFRLVKRMRPDVGLECAESQMIKLPPVHIDTSSSNDSDVDVEIMDIYIEEELLDSTKNTATKSNIIPNSAGSSQISDTNGLSLVESLIPIDDKNGDAHLQYESSQGSLIDPGSVQICTTIAEIHHPPPSRFTEPESNYSNIKPKAKTLPNLDAIDTCTTEPLQLPESSTSDSTCSNMNLPSRLSYINSPQITKGNKKSTALNPFALDLYKNHNLSPPKKRIAIENVSSAAYPIQHCNEKLASQKETGCKTKSDNKLLSPKPKQKLSDKLSNGIGNIFDTSIVEVLGNHPANQIKTQYTTGFWLKQRNMSKHNKHVYRDIRKNNAKESYTTSLWEQKMHQIREKIKVGTDDNENADVINEGLTRAKSSGAPENISEQSQRSDDTKINTKNEKEKFYANKIENYSKIQQNKQSDFPLTRIINYNAAQNTGSAAGADVQINEKTCSINDSQIVRPLNIIMCDDQQTKKPQRIPAYKKKTMNNTERLRSEMEVTLNTNCKDDVLQPDFENIVAHSTLNELDSSLNTNDLIENFTEYSDKLIENDKINKIKIMISKLKSKSSSPMSDNGGIREESKHDERLKIFRLAKKNFAESKRKYAIARAELMKSKAAYEIAEKELYDEILKLKMKEKQKNINE